MHVTLHHHSVDPTDRPFEAGLPGGFRTINGWRTECGASGLALLALRETAALPLSLAIHLGAVMAFFLTMPYGKFAHGIYRVAALLKFAIEKRLPNRLRLGSE